MVSKKSLYYGEYNCFQSSMVPKAPRSIRKSSYTKSTEGSKISPFDLLAAIADQLLQENESSTSSTSPQQKQPISISKDVLKHEESESTNLKQNLDPTLKESVSPQSDNDSGLEHVSDLKTSGFMNNNVKLETCDDKNVDKMTGDTPGDLCKFKSYSSVNLPFHSVRDNDEKCFKFNHRGTKMRAFRSKSNAGYRRIRKMLMSRYRKVTSTKEYEVTNTTVGEMKPHYQNRKKNYNQERCQNEAATKRRKLFHKNSDNGDNTHVKFSIKSFKVPELYIEIPETATIASLKRTVMEAVTAILGGELHVGILHKGKKVRDNNRTLQQTGISQNCDPKTLGFTLEPSFPIEKQSLFDNKNLESIATSAASPVTDVGFSNSSVDCNAEASLLDYNVDRNQEIVMPVQTELAKEGIDDSNSKALVPILEMKSEELSVVAVNHQLSKKCEVSQRRIRRPFSVSEVEALVEAVETLGTGRWRDIKLRAFDDANHRTYVDLKDKWKTLVHTAGIAPQQRRGEPVPQHLLDRVLAAHSYWSQHQRKRESKPVGIMDGSSVEFVGI